MMLATRKAMTLMLIGMLALATASVAPAADWMINEDYKQANVDGNGDGANGLEILIDGDARPQITGGGQSGVTNPFSNPTRAATYNDGLKMTILRFSGSNKIPRDTNTDRHVGVYGSGTKPRVITKAWTYPDGSKIALPKSNFAYSYDGGTSTVTVAVQNTSPYTVTFSEIGYLLSNLERPIEDLTRSTLPASSFSPLSYLNGEYLPGDSKQVILSGVTATDYIVTYGSVQFSGASSGNEYTLTGGEWAEVRAGANVVPEPSSFLALLAGIPVIFTRRRYKNRMVLATLFALIMLLPPVARADVFVIKTLPPVPGDSRPRIPIVIKDSGGNDVTINVVVDTGNGLQGNGGMYIKDSKANSLGMGSGGNAGSAKGIAGGNITTRANVPMPNPPRFAEPPATAHDNTNTAPPLPNQASVGPMNGNTRDGNLGNEWFNNFGDWGFSTGPNGKYMWMVMKDQAASRSLDALRIAKYLAGSTTPSGPDGRPSGRRTTDVHPIQHVPLQGSNTLDGGYGVALSITNPGSGITASGDFILKTGASMTLLSESMASALGLTIPGLPLATVAINVDDNLQVSVAELEVDMFGDPAFPKFQMPVGIIDDDYNPYGDSIVGSDLLNRFDYWEMSVSEDGQTGTFYATVPEPGGLLALGSGLMALAGFAIRRRR